MEIPLSKVARAAFTNYFPSKRMRSQPGTARCQY
jgi:hypothetical protein